MNALKILGKTTAAKTDAGVQETAANPFIHAHARGDFLHVRPGALANGRQWH